MKIFAPEIYHSIMYKTCLLSYVLNPVKLNNTVVYIMEHKQARYSKEERAFLCEIVLQLQRCSETDGADEKFVPVKVSRTKDSSHFHYLQNSPEIRIGLHCLQSPLGEKWMADRVSEILAQDREVPFDVQGNTGRLLC